VGHEETMHAVETIRISKLMGLIRKSMDPNKEMSAAKLGYEVTRTPTWYSGLWTLLNTHDRSSVCY
jgi:hypothetical protein